jgi:ribosomal protein S12 methylthiotransferase accessory factor
MIKRPIRLTDSLKHYTFDQDKVCSPIETVNRFKERLKTVNLDILKEVKRIDNGRLDIPVYFSVTGKDAREVIGNKKQMGKGSTPEQSQASACMELAERFSFFSFKKNPENFIVDTYPNLKKAGYPLMPLERLLQSVHDETTGVELLEKLLEEVPIQWTWASSLNKEEDILIPFSWFYAINEFNGPSAGNSFEEAISQGVCEIIERHVCAIVSHEKLKVPLIDLDSAKDPVSKELVEKFRKNNIELYLNDFTLDTGIPTIGAVAIDRSTFPLSSEIVYTAGTTPNPEKAFIRALTEVAQLAGDFNSKANYVASGLPKPLSMDEIEHLTNPGKTVRLDELPDHADKNMKVEIEHCLAALDKLDMEVYIINTMHEDLQVPTIYTIIPGAHFRERSRSRDAGMFAAKLVAELVTDPVESNDHLMRMEEMLQDAYYIDFYLGRNFLEMGDLEIALTCFKKALSHNPNDEDLPYIYSYMGNCLQNLEQYEDAIAVLKKGASLDIERPDIHNMLGFCNFKLGNYEEAVSSFHRTVELNPASAVDYANLGVNYRKLNQTENAIKFLQLALSLDSSIEFAKTHLEELGQNAISH